MPSLAFYGAWNLSEIDLSHNRISAMASDVFEMNSEKFHSEVESSSTPSASSFLKIIRLNNNNLTFIDPEWFSNHVRLTTLTLNDNFLTEIWGCSAFETNIALRSLHLQNNELYSITIDCVSELDTFDISNNPKHTDSETIFVNAKVFNVSNTNIEKCAIPKNALIVRASHNRINSVRVEYSNSDLKLLFLDHNEIDDASFLLTFELLEELDLSHNRLTQLSTSVFENKDNLRWLGVSHNKISSIDFTFMESTKRLKYLDISSNLLGEKFVVNVDANAMTALNISNNNYTSLQPSLRKRMPNLAQIDLDYNLFDCEELTSTLLFLHFDHITPVLPNGSESQTENVRGIKCHRPVPDSSAPNSTKTSYKMMKDTLIKTFDTKLANLETKLIELFNNMTTPKINDIEQATKTQNHRN